MDLYKMGLRPTSPTRPITPDCHRSKHSSRFGMWQKLQHFFGRDESLPPMGSDIDVGSNVDEPKFPRKCEASARPVGVGLPRQATFKRQNSERRERLCPIEPPHHERRALSTSRPRSTAAPDRLRSSSVPSPSQPTRHSAPVIGNTVASNGSSQSDRHDLQFSYTDDQQSNNPDQPIEYDRSRPPRPASITSSIESYEGQGDFLEENAILNRELETKWILNLSMHFRDKSDREKFFVTYAETPTRWRRVTVSCDYRNAESGSLEKDLKELQLQRDKSMQIYEAIRESLLEIKFYDTVTNLKLETSDGRLHVHVTEDVNEIIPYPPIGSLQHIFQDADYSPRRIRESELSFDAHLSGFVYKVMYRNRAYIKKEIPGPDTVDEFLYEVNALHALQDSRNIINLEGIITDESGQLIKGLLIDHAEQGAVVDLLYDYKGEIAWEHRERWARHAIQGLSEIHEEGYVQGDFTLSNIVVDRDNNARIIDINRRGCPVGWEPPELAKKIASNQRISMYIGQKSDLYQLGMTLWALAMDDDEPERHDPPLSTQEFPVDVPPWFQDIVRICLSTRPRDRLSATDLVKMFPNENHSSAFSQNGRPVVRIRTEKQYIDPATAVERADLERFRHGIPQFDDTMYSPESSRDDYTFTWPQSSNYDREFDSASSVMERPRGRRRISDQDDELQAQRRRERLLQDDEFEGGQELDNDYHERTPIISISQDGNETHILDTSYNVSTIREASDDVASEFVDFRTESPLPPLSSLEHLADRRLFQGFSDVNDDDTPRNSNTRLPSTAIDSFEPSPDTPSSNTIPNELAGLGSHPNVSDHSFEQIQYESEEGTQNVPNSVVPSLAFRDSGYNEPAAFGIEPDNDLPPSVAASQHRMKQIDGSDSQIEHGPGSSDAVIHENHNMKTPSGQAEVLSADRGATVDGPEKEMGTNTVDVEVAPKETEDNQPLSELSSAVALAKLPSEVTSTDKIEAEDFASNAPTTDHPVSMENHPSTMTEFIGPDARTSDGKAPDSGQSLLVSLTVPVAQSTPADKVHPG